MRPNITGTRSTSIWIDMAPRLARARLRVAARLARKRKVGRTPSSAAGPPAGSFFSSAKVCCRSKKPAGGPAADQGVRPTMSPHRVRGIELLWFLIPTASYEFGLFIRAVRLAFFYFFVPLLFLHRRQERLREIRQLGSF